MINTVTFEKKDVGEIVTSLGLEIDKKSRIINEGEPAHCHVCDESITTENLGNVSKGSKIFYCDKLGCFAFRSIERLEEK